MLKRFLFVMLCMLCITINAVAEIGNVKGQLKDADNGQPIEFATVAITDANGKMITGGITDLDGMFNIQGLKVGKYTVTCSYMGYTPFTINIDITRNGQTANIGTRNLQPETSQLEEVQVTGKASQMRFELDRKVFDASNNIAAEGGSASDLLATVPSVEVDNDGSVSLRGNSSVTIWINGKASGLSAENQGDILQLLPADNIKQIEVITNPSAKYSPEGSAGIINIVLKDERTSGYFGSLKAGGNTNGGYHFSGNVSVNVSKWEFGLDLSRRHRRMVGGGEAYQEVLSPKVSSLPSPLSILEEKSESENGGGNWFGRFKLTFHPTPKNDIGIVLAGMNGDGENEEEIHYTQYGDGLGDIRTDNLYYTSVRNTNSDSENQMRNMEFNFRHTFSDTHFIDFSASKFGWEMDNDAVYKQNFNYVNSTNSSTNQVDNSTVDNKGKVLQLDYTVTIADELKLEAGYKGQFQKNKSTTDRTETDGSNMYQDFKYNQDTHAGYLTLGGKIGDMTLQGGLRAEQWEFETIDKVKQRASGSDNAVNNESTANKSFFKFFPSLFVSYALPSGNELQVNYTRRLRRPWGGQLNPSRQISDAYNIRFGNPELTPEYTNAFELNYIKMWESGQTLSFSAYYRATSDVMDHISFTQGNIRYNTQANVSDRKSLGSELVGKNRISNWLELTTTLNLFYQKIEAYRYAPDKDWLALMTGSTETTSVVEGDEQNSFNWNVRMIGNFTLPANISMQATGMYRGKSKGVQGYVKPMGGLDLGLKKSFCKDKLVLSINGRNVLNTRKFRSVFESETMYQESKRWRNKCTFGCTLTWKFGNLNLNKKKGPGGPEGDEDGGGVSYSGGGDE